MRDSSKYLDRLIQCFKQKKVSIDRNRFQQQQLQEKAELARQEEQVIKEKSNLLISYTKKLKEQVRHRPRRVDRPSSLLFSSLRFSLPKIFSAKKYPNRRVNIMGEINTL